MWTLADGAYIELELAGRDSRIVGLRGGAAARVGARERGLLTELLYGLDGGGGRGAILAALQARGLVADKPDLDDPLLQQRLAQLDAPWSWQWPGGRLARPFARLLEAVRRAHARRKVFVQDYGQTPCLPETAARRAWLSRGQPGRALCVGDDDLVSVALALLGHQVVVYDIDDTVLIPWLNHLARAWRLDLRAERLDLRAPLPRAARAAFDWVYSDPMSTRGCLELFLSRSLAALRPGGQAAVCVHAAALDTWRTVAEAMRLDVQAHHREFCRYYSEGYVEDFYRSDLVLLRRGGRERLAMAAGRRAEVDIFAGLEQHRMHAWCELRSVTGAITAARLQPLVAQLLDSALLPLVSVQRDLPGPGPALVATLAGGGQFSLEATADGRLLRFDVYPYDEARDTQVLELLLRWLPPVEVRYQHQVVRPHRLVLPADPAL